MPVPEVFVDQDSVVFIQENGPCSAYAAMPCHAIDSADIAYSDAVRVYCKDPGKRGARIVARTVKGLKESGTLTIQALSQKQSDLLYRIYQKNCMFGAQTHLDQCGLPTDNTAYTKLLDYYGIMPGGLAYSNVDNLEGGEGAGLQINLACTFDDIIEVLKCTLTRIGQTVITVTDHITDIDVDLTEWCASDCGSDRDACTNIIAVTTFLAGPAVGQMWYSTDNGVTWTATGVAPFAADGATVTQSACIIIEDRWISFLGALFAGLAGRCSYTDNSGGAWTAVDMGGTAAADYVTNAYLHNAGSLWACGGDSTPSGHVWFSDDRAQSWTMFEDVNTQILRDIATADGDTIYAVGDANTIIKSTDQGLTWTTLTGPASGVGFDLLSVRALTSDHVLVGGEVDANGEQLWCSLDGGTTWTAKAFTDSTTASTMVHSMDLARKAGKQHVWMIHGVTSAASNYCFRSVDGGHSWQRWPVLDNDNYNRISACDSNHAWIAGDTDAAQGGTGTVARVDPVS